MRYLTGSQADQYLAQIDASGTVGWFLTDHLGSVRDIMNNSGTIVYHADYDAFGNITYEVDSGNRALVGYAGYQWDAGISLFYCNNRWLNPVTQQWMENDPSGFAAGDPNLRRDVWNSPTNGTDPSGLKEKNRDFFTWTADTIGTDNVLSLDNVLGHVSNGWFTRTSDGAAGMGDTITFGATARGREAGGFDDVVNHDSEAYHRGVIAGRVWQVAFVLAGGPVANLIYFGLGSPFIIWNMCETTAGYRKHGVETGPAVTMGVLGNLPVFGSVVSAFEIAEGRSLRPGPNFGEKLNGWDYTDRGTGIAADVITIGGVTYKGMRGGVGGDVPIRPGTLQPRGGNGVILPDGAGATPAEIAASSGGPTGGSRVGQGALRNQLINEWQQENPGQPFECWRCGETSTNAADMHLGHRNRPVSLGGNQSPPNIALEGAACNLSAGNRGAPSPGMSCVERGSCGAPYGR